MGWQNEKKENDRSACRREKRWVLSFDLKEESEDECLTERKRVPDHWSDALKSSPPGSSGPSQEHGISEYPR